MERFPNGEMLFALSIDILASQNSPNKPINPPPFRAAMSFMGRALVGISSPIFAPDANFSSN
jgi:hypothetical protein